MNNVMTASRMTCAMTCLRKHFWSFEVGLRKTQAGVSLRFGSAWARAMEARWAGSSYEDALAIAVPEGVDLNPYDCNIVSALLGAYYAKWKVADHRVRIQPEQKFQSQIEGTDFTAEGKIDGIGLDRQNQALLVEAKTTSDSLNSDSLFWLRLDFNMQVLQYALEARTAGWDVRKVVYDVTRKPQIQPKQVVDLDGQGRKIVLDANGNRMFATKQMKTVTKVGKKKVERVQTVDDESKPRQSANKELGQVLKSHVETPEEFSDRLYDDALERPYFYFARREVPIVDDQLEAFSNQRLAICRIIETCRKNEHPTHGQQEAWPRNVSEHTCNYCQFKSFCLQNITPDLSCLPEGFEIGPFNPELQDENQDLSEQNSTAAT